MKKQNYEIIDVKEVNEVRNNDILVIAIKVKKIKTENNEFNSVKAKMYLRCFKNSNDKVVEVGYRYRWVDLKFTRGAFKTDCYDGLCVRDADDLKTGTLYVNSNYVDAPTKYLVTKNEDGEDVYPCIWVRGGIIGFQKFKPTQDAFNVHQTQNDVIDVEVDETTGEVIESDETDEVVEL